MKVLGQATQGGFWLQSSFWRACLNLAFLWFPSKEFLVHVLLSLVSCAHLLSHVLVFVTPWTASCKTPLSMDFPNKNTGVGCHFLLQGIFLTRGLNPCFLRLLHCRQVPSCWAMGKAFSPSWHYKSIHKLLEQRSLLRSHSWRIVYNTDQYERSIPSSTYILHHIQ